MTAPLPWDAVAVTIGDRDLYLRFSLAATARLQSALNVGSLREVTQLIDSLNPKRGPDDQGEGKPNDWLLDVNLPLLHTVLWVGLGECLAVAGDRVTTKDDIGAAISLRHIPDVLAKLVLAITFQFAAPPPQPDNPDPLPPGPAPTVTPSPNPG